MSGFQGVALSQTSSLEHRSSMRKLSFPHCTQEALIRLSAHCEHWAVAKPAPKEIEVVLDAVEEFIFNYGQKPSKSSSSGSDKYGAVFATGTETAMALQELQMLQVLLDFFTSNEADRNLSFAILLFLFMESSKLEKGGGSGTFLNPKDIETSVGKMSKRTGTMAKFISLAIATQNKSILECCGMWLHYQGPFSERALQVAYCLSEEFILLLKQSTESLRFVPEIAPLFAANLLASLAHLYDMENLPPPKLALLQLASSWIRAYPLLPINGWFSEVQKSMPPSSITALGGAGGASSIASSIGQAPYVGLARWTILGAIKDANSGHDVHLAYSDLHLNILEGLVEVSNLNRSKVLTKSDLIPVKKIVALIDEVNLSLESIEKTEKDQGETKQVCLDRLGQFLQSATSSGLLSGKTAEIITALKKLPKTRLIELYVANLVKF